MNPKNLIGLFGQLWGDGQNESGSDGTDASRKVPSALKEIDSAEEVPSSVSGYELEMNSPISVRWHNRGNSCSVVCSLVDGVWVTKRMGKESGGVFGVFETRAEAIEKAEEVMQIYDEDDEEKADEKEGTLSGTRFEDEVESVLEEVDVESVEAVRESLSD